MSLELKEIAPDQMDLKKKYLVLGLFDWGPRDRQLAPTNPVWRVVAYEDLGCFEWEVVDGVVQCVTDEADGQWWVQTDNPYGDEILAIYKVYELPA